MFKATIAVSLGIYLVLAFGAFEASILVISYGVHEVFHLVAARILGLHVQGGLGMFGVRLRTEAQRLGAAGQLLLYLSGPAGNLLLAANLLLASTRVYVPGVEFMVFYNLVLGLVNLVPAYPLDAARALEGLLIRLFGRLEAVRYVCYLTAGVAAATFSVGFYLFLSGTDNFLLMALGAFFFYSAGREARASEAQALAVISARLGRK